MKFLTPRMDGKSIMSYRAFMQWKNRLWFAGKSKEATIDEVQRRTNK